MTDQNDIIYRVNQSDEIVFVNQAWDRFSSTNGGEKVTSAEVLNRFLWEFITESTTQELYRQVLRRIRSGRSLQFNFRCDSPECRRLLEMHVYRAEGDTIEFRTHELSKEFREPPIILDSHAARSQEMLRACGWCKKVFVADAWVEAEEAVKQLRLFEQSLMPNMTHGICPPCYEIISEKIDSETD